MEHHVSPDAGFGNSTGDSPEASRSKRVHTEHAKQRPNTLLWQRSCMDSTQRWETGAGPGLGPWLGLGLGLQLGRGVLGLGLGWGWGCGSWLGLGVGLGLGLGLGLG